MSALGREPTLACGWTADLSPTNNDPRITPEDGTKPDGEINRRRQSNGGKGYVAKG